MISDFVPEVFVLHMLTFKNPIRNPVTRMQDQEINFLQEKSSWEFGFL